MTGGCLVERAADRVRLGHLNVSVGGRGQQGGSQKEVLHLDKVEIRKEAALSERLEAPGCELEARSEVTGEVRLEARVGFEVFYLQIRL